MACRLHMEPCVSICGSIWIVMIYDPISLNMLVTIPENHSLLYGVLYSTYVPISNELVVGCTWFLDHTASACKFTCTPCPSYILAPSDIGRPDLACWVHNNSIGIASHCQAGVSLYNITAKWEFSSVSLALDSNLFTCCTYLFASPWIDCNVMSLCCGAWLDLPCLLEICDIVT